jgi:hypothetical protein
MDSEYYDEEGLLKVIQAAELSEAITRLNWNWDNYSNSIKEAHELIAKSQKLFVEISEYQHRLGSKLHRLGSKLGKNQKEKISNSIEDLGRLIPYIKNKIRPTESLEIVNQTDKSLA